MAKGKNNRLSREASPYLLQHADNPVDWYPWSQEAFEEAKRLDRPVFLSIGYSTCHWCHVMEKESFENEHIAELMNSNFINIKVDREQYPDVDDVYMNAVQMMTGSGGWPLSVFLTPDKLPFFGGTYFPPSDTLNMPGFEKVLLTIADAWEKRQDELIDSASYITKSIKRHTPSQVEGKPTEAMIQKAYNFFRTNFDLQNGGFGGAPKFPQPLVLDFILNYYYRSGDEYALRMVTETLDTIADSGIHDHIGGGFHRYATDKNWLIPHFEKMLYDQAQLANVYLHAYQITGKDKYKRVVDKILKYVSRDMQNSEGGFYSAEDADSDGKEGGFYVWRPEEFDECLQEQSEILKNYYNVFEEGNFEDATSVLNVNESDSFFASRSGKDEKQFRQYVDRADAKLMAWRNQRTRPMRDEKIIVSWNALMISAFANAARILSEPEYADISEKSAGFILDRLFKDNSLARFCKKDKIVGQGYLEDYAFLGTALIDLYESTKEIKWLKTSLQLVDLMIDKFHSEGSGLFHHSSQRTDKVLDDKPLYDHATSSGNSAAVSLLIKTYLLTGDRKYYQLAENILIESYSVLTNMPQASAGMLMASDLYLGPAREVVIVAKAINGEVNEFQEIINKTYLPDTVILYNVPEGIIADYSPQFAGHVCRDNKVTAYVCSGFVCEKPVTDKDNFEQLLKPLKRNL